MQPADSSILWIGRMRFFAHLRIRELELADRVARTAKLFALDRSDAKSWDRQSLPSKLALRWELARGGWEHLNDGPFTRFRMPLVVATGPVMNRVAARLNERRIEEALERFGCGTVFHSHPFLFLPREAGRRSYRCHFDLVDNYFDEFPDSIIGRSRKRFLHDAMLRADSISTISLSLCDRVEEFTGRRPAYVPNGAALGEIRSWPAERVQAVRERHSLNGKLALTYIGNHIASFDGMEMLLGAFLEARKARPELVLLIVGPDSERVPRARGVGPADGIHVVGPVLAKDVWDYFHAADLGLLPFLPSPATHDAMPLKVVEFGAARKPVLATPLRELRRLALPHVRFAAHDGDTWRRALLDDATYAKPDPAVLEESLRPFCWDACTESLLKVMEIGSPRSS